MVKQFVCLGEHAWNCLLRFKEFPSFVQLFQVVVAALNNEVYQTVFCTFFIIFNLCISSFMARDWMREAYYCRSFCVYLYASSVLVYFFIIHFCWPPCDSDLEALTLDHDVLHTHPVFSPNNTDRSSWRRQDSCCGRRFSRCRSFSLSEGLSQQTGQWGTMHGRNLPYGWSWVISCLIHCSDSFSKVVGLLRCFMVCWHCWIFVLPCKFFSVGFFIILLTLFHLYSSVSCVASASE